MKLLIKFFLVVLLVLLVLGSCKTSPDDVFTFNIKDGFNIETTSSFQMDALVKTTMQINKDELFEAEMTTLRKFEASIISSNKITDSDKLGKISFSEKVSSAKYSVVQNRDHSGENSVALTFNDGKAVTEKKSLLGKVIKDQPDFEEAARETFMNMIKDSEREGVATVEKNGNLVSVDAEMSIKSAIVQEMHNKSGFFGIVFPQNKRIKEGDTWIEKKVVSFFDGLQILGNPLDIEVLFKRNNDEYWNGREVAIFSAEYSFKKDNVNGIYETYHVLTNLSGEYKTIFYFDKLKKRLLKKEFFSKSTFAPGDEPDKSQYPLQYKIDLNMKNIFSYVSIFSEQTK